MTNKKTPGENIEGEGRDKGEGRAQAEKEVHAAANEYAKKSGKAESKFGEGVKRLFSKDTLVKIGILEGLELLPVFAGYSAADLYAAVDGLLDVVYGVVSKEQDSMDRITSGVRGVTKIAVAAIPGAPASGIAPALDALLPTSRDTKVVQKAEK